MAALLSGGGRGKGLAIKMYIYIYIYILFYFIFLFRSCAIKKNILLKTKKYFISILTTQFFFCVDREQALCKYESFRASIGGGWKKTVKIRYFIED